MIKKYFFSDGLDHKDWLLLWSSIVFFMFIIIGLISSLIGNPIDETYLELLKMVSPVLMTIVGGVFGVNIASEFRNSKKDTNNHNYDEEI